MTTIISIRQLPWCRLRAYAVPLCDNREAEALRIAAGRKAWLFKQTEKAWYVFVEE